MKYHREYQQEILIAQFLKYLQLENQPLQLFTRIKAYHFCYLSLLETFLVLKASFSLVAHSILLENSGEEQA